MLLVVSASNLLKVVSKALPARTICFIVDQRVEFQHLLNGHDVELRLSPQV
jgi:hypothetical protein